MSSEESFDMPTPREEPDQKVRDLERDLKCRFAALEFAREVYCAGRPGPSFTHHRRNELLPSGSVWEGET